MKPIVLIWVRSSAIKQIGRDRFPSEWRAYDPYQWMSPTEADENEWIQINVPIDWFNSMLEYEYKLASNDLPF